MARKTQTYTINIIGGADAVYMEGRIARMAQTVYDICGERDGVRYKAVKKKDSPCVGAQSE